MKRRSRRRHARSMVVVRRVRARHHNPEFMGLAAQALGGGLVATGVSYAIDQIDTTPAMQLAANAIGVGLGVAAAHFYKAPNVAAGMLGALAQQMTDRARLLIAINKIKAASAPTATTAPATGAKGYGYPRPVLHVPDAVLLDRGRPGGPGYRRAPGAQPVTIPSAASLSRFRPG